MNSQRRAAIDALLIRLQSTGLHDARAILDGIRDDLDAIKSEEEDARDNLPDSLRESEKGEAMDEAIDHLSTAIDAIDAVLDALDLDQLDEAADALNSAKGDA